MRGISVIAATFVLAATFESSADPVRRCWIEHDGQRHCEVVDRGGHRPPPDRHRPPVRPRPPERPRPPIYRPPVDRRPPVVRPRPPIYRPPIYRPPVHRPGWEYYRARDLVQRLETSVDWTIRGADREAMDYNSEQMEWAVTQLYQLLDQVQELRMSIDRYSSTPAYSSNDYRRMKREFEDAREAMYNAYFSESVDRDFDDVERIVFELDGIYWGY